MAEIFADTGSIKKQGEQFEGIVSCLAKAELELQAVDNKISRHLSSQSYRAIRRRISGLSDQIKRNKGNIQTLKSVLDSSRELYQKTESEIEAYFKKEAGKDSKAQFDYDWKKFLGSFGNVGKVFSIFDKVIHAKRGDEWASVVLSAGQTISKIVKDYGNYTKIGRAIGSKKAMAYFWRKQFGFRNVGYASTARSPTARFYNNLHNTGSAYNLNDAFAPLTGKKGVATTAAAWAGVVLSGVTNAFNNIDEQKQSNGTMSTGRVVAETISETAIDTVVAYAGTAVVGAAITAATGVVFAPAVVAIATGVAIAGINAGVEALTGKSTTEWLSDKILDTASAVGNAVSNGAKAVANWFSRLSFA